jgi:hypothetical protein
MDAARSALPDHERVAHRRQILDAVGGHPHEGYRAAPADRRLRSSSARALVGVIASVRRGQRP